MGLARMLHMYIAQQYVGYRDVGKRAENADKVFDWHVAMHPSLRKTLKKKSAETRKGNAGKDQGQHAYESRAMLSCREAPVQASKDALPRSGEEQRPDGHAVPFRQSNTGTQAPGAGACQVAS